MTATTTQEKQALLAPIARQYDPYSVEFKSEALGCWVRCECDTDDGDIYAKEVIVRVGAEDVDFMDHLNDSTLRVIDNEARDAVDRKVQDLREESTISDTMAARGEL